MQLLKQLRKQNHLTQDKLAKDLSLSRSAISMYEIDASEPDFETTCKIADYFNVSVDFLLGRVSNESEKLTEQSQHTMIRLKELRGSKSQQQIANAVGISQRTYCNYENGTRYPDYDTLIKLADYFGVTLDYLLGRSVQPEDEKNITESNLNTVIAFGRGGERKEFTLTNEQADMVNTMLEALSKKDK